MNILFLQCLVCGPGISLRAALPEAQALAEHLLNSAEKFDDSVCRVLAHEALGFTSFAQGKFAAAHAELERSIGLCEDNKAAAYFDLSAQDPRVHVRSYDAMALWFLGYPDQALRLCAEARNYGDASRHPFSEAMARTISFGCISSAVEAEDRREPGEQRNCTLRRARVCSLSRDGFDVARVGGGSARRIRKRYCRNSGRSGTRTGHGRVVVYF